MVMSPNKKKKTDNKSFESGNATFATAAGEQTGTRGSSGAAISILGLQHHKADHDGDETYRGDHQGKDDGWRRVAQLLGGAVHEEILVEVHEQVLHQPVGPRDQQAVGYVLRALAQITVKAAGEKNTVAPLMCSLPEGKRFFFMRAPAARTTHRFTLCQSQWSLLLSCSIDFLNLPKHQISIIMARHSIEGPSK